MIIKNYSIGDIVTFQIRNSLSTVNNYFEQTNIQFDNFLTNISITPDFTVELGPFNRQKKKIVILDDTYFISDGYIFFKGKRKLSKWKVQISNLEKSPTISIDTNFVGNITVPVNFIEFLIQYIILKKGFSIIHASGVGKNNKCVIFPARSGGGKTTLALSLLNEGFSFLGDNYIVLDKGYAKSYISPLNIFTYNRMPIIDNNLDSKQKLSMGLKKSIYSLSSGYFKIFEKINPFNLFGESIVEKLPINIILLLEVGDSASGDELHYNQIKKEYLIKKLRYNMELDLLEYTKWIYSYGYAKPESTLSNFWDLYEKNLINNLPDDVPYLSIKAPRKWKKNSICKVLDLLNNNI